MSSRNNGKPLSGRGASSRRSTIRTSVRHYEVINSPHLHHLHQSGPSRRPTGHRPHVHLSTSVSLAADENTAPPTSLCHDQGRSQPQQQYHSRADPLRDQVMHQLLSECTAHEMMVLKLSLKHRQEQLGPLAKSSDNGNGYDEDDEDDLNMTMMNIDDDGDMRVRSRFRSESKTTIRPVVSQSTSQSHPNRAMQASSSTSQPGVDHGFMDWTLAFTSYWSTSSSLLHRQIHNHSTAHDHMTAATGQPSSLFDLLADEILLHIFARVNHASSLSEIARVCRRWGTLLRDNVLWKRMCHAHKFQPLVVVSRRSQPHHGALRRGSITGFTLSRQGSSRELEVVSGSGQSSSARHGRSEAGHHVHCRQRRLRRRMGSSTPVNNNTPAANSGYVTPTRRDRQSESGQGVRGLEGKTRSHGHHHIPSDVIRQHLVKRLGVPRGPSLAPWKAVYKQNYLTHLNWKKGRYTVEPVTPFFNRRGNICLNFDENWAVSVTINDGGHVWDMNTGHCHMRLNGHEGVISTVKLDQKYIVTGGVDATLKIWDAETRECIMTLRGHESEISAVQYDHRYIISSSEDKTIRVWLMADGQEVLVLRGHEGAVVCLHFDGDQIVSGSTDSTIKVWNISTGENETSLQGHTGNVYCLQRLNNLLCSGSADTTIKVWDLTSQTCLKTLHGHKNGVVCIQFDQSKIVSGSGDNTIKVWDFGTGNCLYTLRGHTAAVWNLRFNILMSLFLFGILLL
ncbi:hypothetical protein HDU76_010957 [Blyttiomyces sp. JEL0837]|nr:hypothetical protein HDU76_010957 [Blyttiomyces sp. JEL0837]